MYIPLPYLTNANVQKKISLISINRYKSLTKKKHSLENEHREKLPTPPKYYTASLPYN